MSIKAMSVVWAHFNRGGSEKLVLLALADFANDDNTLYPAMKTIAAKTCISTDQARRIVHGLMREGIVEVVANGAGGKPGTTPVYQLHLERLTAGVDASPTPCADASPTGGMDARGTACMDAADALHGCKGRAGTGASLTVIEPSRTRKEAAHAAPSPAAKRKSNPITLKAFFEHCRAQGDQPIPHDDPVWDYAEKVGIPGHLLELAWKEFAHRHRESGKRQADWRATFRNAVRGNWMKVWTFDAGGACVITGQGRQVQAAHREVPGLAAVA